MRSVLPVLLLITQKAIGFVSADGLSKFKFADEVSGGAGNGHADDNAALKKEKHETGTSSIVQRDPARKG